jgi:hypothetical protein
MEDLKEKTDNGDEGSADEGVMTSERAPAKKGGGAFAKGGRSVELTVAPLKLQRVEVKLVGITPLLVNHFNNKGVGLTEMRDKQMGKPKPKVREAKDPVRCFKDSLYCTGEPKIHGTIEDFLAGKPVTATAPKGAFFYLPFGMFKGAIETAALTADGVNKAGVQRAVRIVQGKIPIKGSDPVMEEDVVRLKDIGRTADLRYRARFDEWSAQFTVEFLADVMNAQTVVNLFNRAGFTSGLGEWRPEKGGEMGRFKMETADE